MQRADHGRGVEQAIHKREAVDIRGNIYILIGCAESLLGLLQLGARIIEQDYALKAEVARRISSGAGAQFQQDPSAFGEKSLESDRFGTVLILTSTFIPKGGLIIGAFVVTNGGS